MNNKLSIVLCEDYQKEAEYVIEKEGLSDIQITFLSANCMKCKINDKKSYNPEEKFKMCYSMLAGETLVNSYNKQGYYILTPGWLVKWKSYVIDLWGFDSSTAKIFFKESASKLMLLDSGVYENIDVYLKEFSEFVSLDYTVIPVGIDYFRNHIMNMYLNWKNNENKIIAEKKTKEVAQFAFMSDMVYEINKLMEIEHVINKMFELFVMLTGASKVAYIRVVRGKVEKVFTYRNEAYNGELLEKYLDSDFDKAFIKESNRGFILKTKVREGIFHYLEVDDVAVSEHIQEYVKMTMDVFRICSLIIFKRKEYYELIKSKIELEEESKAKSTFIANISHELRTPINVLFSAIQLFQGMIKSSPHKHPPKVSIHLKSMKQNCFRLLRLVNNIIDITKIEASFMNMDFKNENIVSIVEEITLSVAQYAKEKGLYVEFDTEDEEIITAMDVEKIDRITFNLLSNAVKFTKKGGSIFVNIYREEERVLISVRDTGIGIPNDKIDKVFDRFIQVEDTLIKTHEGSGIGLAIVKSLVEMHQGSISVTSNVGVGTEFIVELPIKTLPEQTLENEYIEDREQDIVQRLNIEFSDIYLER